MDPNSDNLSQSAKENNCLNANTHESNVVAADRLIDKSPMKESAVQTNRRQTNEASDIHQHINNAIKYCTSVSLLFALLGLIYPNHT